MRRRGGALRAQWTPRPTKPKLNLDAIANELTDYHRRLNGVIIEHEDALSTIRRYDAPETLFFVDPPYHEADESGEVEFVFDKPGHGTYFFKVKEKK